MQGDINRVARLRRECRRVRLFFKKTPRNGSEHGPYHLIEPIRNSALSAARYPNGMTLDEAEAFVAGTAFH
jgi:hypothetical protein